MFPAVAEYLNIKKKWDMEVHVSVSVFFSVPPAESVL
jgi:hypothetical protein